MTNSTENKPAAAKKPARVYRVNPKIRFELPDGGMIEERARIVLSPHLSFDDDTTDREATKIESFLNAAFDEGLLYYTIIGGYPVFVESLETTIRGR